MRDRSLNIPLSVIPAESLLPYRRKQQGRRLFVLTVKGRSRWTIFAGVRSGRERFLQILPKSGIRRRDLLIRAERFQRQPMHNFKCLGCLFRFPGEPLPGDNATGIFGKRFQRHFYFDPGWMTDGQAVSNKHINSPHQINLRTGQIGREDSRWNGRSGCADAPERMTG